MTTSLFKRCGCTEIVTDETGLPLRDGTGKAKRRRLGNACPDLKRTDGAWNPGHGTWFFHLELPTVGGQRDSIRAGGYPTRDEAKKTMDAVAALIALADKAEDKPATTTMIATQVKTALKNATPLPDPDELRKRIIIGQPMETDTTVESWLRQWLAAKKNDLRPTTHLLYTGHAERYLIPALGKYRIDRLRVAHVQHAFDALAEQALETAAANALRRAAINAARAAWHAGDKTTAAEIHTQITAMPPFRRPINAATIQRIRAVLRAALTDAMRQQLITVNVASLVKLPSGRSPKPLVWTDARVSAWLCTGAVPSPVMVWTAPQTAVFLRRAAKHRLFALYLLIAHYGLRRGEACGLRWADIDLDTGLIEISQQIVQIGWDAKIGDTKTDNGRRTIALTPADVRALQRHRLVAEDEASTHGGWPDTGLVFTNPDGTALHPATVTSQFHLLAKEAALPPVRLHDVRHGAATHALAAGVEMKVVSDILGHATTGITADIYTSVIDDLKKAAATKIADHIGFNADDAVEL